MTLGPTAQQMRTIGDLLAARRFELAGLVHNLSVLTQATAADDNQLASVVTAGDTTIHALATQDTALQAAVTKLPGTLATTSSTLTDLTSFSDQLGPTATDLIPTAKDLPNTLRDSKTLIQGAALLPLNKVRAFESVVLPLAAELPSVASGLKTAVPELTSSFKVLNYVTNEIAYDPGNGNPGFLYWLGWFAHNVDSFLGNSDANGTAWRVLILTSCDSLKSFSFGPLLEDLLGTTFGCA
jgi:phospholipid/cholesterol/gamma-HCH transport system substrate-binding protein